MRVHRTDDASEFLNATLALRSADPVRTNVLGSVATGVAQGIGYDDVNFFVVHDADDDVVGAAMWTAPYKLHLSPMNDAAATAVADALQERSRATGLHPGGVVGPNGTAEVAAAHLGRPFRTKLDERVLVLHDYLQPRPVAGAARQPDENDLDLLREWRTAFAIEAGVQVTHDESLMLAALPRTWLWEVDGSPVSMAGHAPIVETPDVSVGRVGPVYTPPDVRGYGYGTAATAVVVDALLPQVDVVMLFTNASNVTSNQVYEALGFVHAADVVELDFTDA
jgi:predicted GNAT family acetyltransferase